MALRTSLSLFCLLMFSFALKVHCQTNEKIGVLLTHWGQPRGWNLEYSWENVPRAMLGTRQSSPTQPCTGNFVGDYPYSWQIGLLPFAIMADLGIPGLSEVYDGKGVYWLDPVRQVYVSVLPSHPSIRVQDVPQGIPIVPISESDLETETTLYGRDPRSGVDHLEGWFVIGSSEVPYRNGLSDLQESVTVSILRSVRMAGAPEESIERDLLEATALDILETTELELKSLYGDLVDVRQGGYIKVPLVNPTLDEVTLQFAQEGFSKLVVARETTDNNNYANVFMTRSYVDKALCENGYQQSVKIEQVKQVGRTPEYNEALLQLLEPHLRKVPPGSQVAIIYMSRGLPWGGAEGSSPFQAGSSPFHSPHPNSKEVYHENVLLNFLSFKRAAKQRFGKEYNLVFERIDKLGSDLRVDNHLVYGTTTENSVKGVFKTWRQAIQDAKKDGNRNIITLLSHWMYSFYETFNTCRELNNVPLSPLVDLEKRIFNGSWCEDDSGPVSCDSPSKIAELSVTETFEHTFEPFSVGYAGNIRGGIERFGVFPPKFGIKILASKVLSKLEGGSVEVLDASSSLYGVSLQIIGDPYPTRPEDFTPETAIPPNDPQDTMDCLWEDSIFYIGTYENGTLPEPALGVPVISNVYFGPYRTLFNRGVTITFPLAPISGRLNQQEISSSKATFQPMVYNDYRKDWDLLLGSPSSKMPLNEVVLFERDQRLFISFHSDFLGVFAVVQV